MDIKEKAENYAKERIEDWAQWHDRCREQVINLMIEFNNNES